MQQLTKSASAAKYVDVREIGVLEEGTALVCGGAIRRSIIAATGRR